VSENDIVRIVDNARTRQWGIVGETGRVYKIDRLRNIFVTFPNRCRHYCLLPGDVERIGRYA